MASFSNSEIYFGFWGPDLGLEDKQGLVSGVNKSTRRSWAILYQMSKQGLWLCDMMHTLSRKKRSGINVRTGRRRRGRGSRRRRRRGSSDKKADSTSTHHIGSQVVCHLSRCVRKKFICATYIGRGRSKRLIKD